MKRDVWGLFHDGVLSRIEGVVPGNVRLEVEIDYLRRMFVEPGSTFQIELSGCSQFVYREYDREPTGELQQIQEREPEILYVTSEQPLILDCAMGTLELNYEGVSIKLPSGKEVSYEALVSACERYWNDWSARAR